MSDNKIHGEYSSFFQRLLEITIKLMEEIESLRFEITELKKKGSRPIITALTTEEGFKSDAGRQYMNSYEGTMERCRKLADSIIQEWRKT